MLVHTAPRSEAEKGAAFAGIVPLSEALGRACFDFANSQWLAAHLWGSAPFVH